MDNDATNLIEKPEANRHYQPMPRRVRELLKQAEAWCAEERGRRTELAKYLGVSLPAVSAWFREYRKQILGIMEFLQGRRQEDQE
jgi:predicted transcriptional regulator